MNAAMFCNAPNISFPRIDPDTGKLAPPGSPEAIFEVFTQETTPEEMAPGLPGGAALPIWIEYMRTALEYMPESIMEQPEGLVHARIDPGTGKLAPPGSPDAIFEVFRPEYAPKEMAPNMPVDTYNDDNNSTSVPEIF